MNGNIRFRMKFFTIFSKTPIDGNGTLVKQTFIETSQKAQYQQEMLFGCK